MIYHWKSILKRGLAALCLIAGLTGCSRGIPSVSDSKETGRSYSMAEMMLIVATERNRYEQIFTDQIWDVEINSGGVTFMYHLLNQVKYFLEELRTINLLAEEQDITLTEQEKDKLRELADDYYSKLTDADRAYIQATREEVFSMYQEYHLANKVVEAMTQDINLEISDSDAKVIAVMELCTSDAAAAEEALLKLQEEGADFSAIAKSYTETEAVNRKIGRGGQDSAYDQAAFALTRDEVSPIFQVGDNYYILKCVSDYEEAATQERKQELSMQRRSDAFHQIYKQFAGEHQVSFDDTLFDGLVFSPDDGTTTSNFFKMYQEYMKN